MSWGISAVVSALFEGAAISVEKKALIREHAMEFTASMILFAMLFTTPLWIFTEPEKISLVEVGLTFLSALFMCLSILFFAKAMRHMAAPYTNPFLSTGPIIICIFAYYMLGEQLSTLQGAGVLLTFIGSYTLYSHIHHSIFEPLKKAFMIPHLRHVFLGIIFFSLSSVIDKKVVGGEHLALGLHNYIPLLYFMSGVIMIVMMLLFHDGFSGIGNGMKNNTLFLSAIALLTVLSKSIILYALSIPGVMISLLFSIRQLSLIITMAVAGDLHHKDNLARKAMGVVLMVGGAVLILL